MIYFNNSKDIPPEGHPDAEFWISNTQRDRSNKQVKVGAACCVLHKNGSGYRIRRFKIEKLVREKHECYIFSRKGDVLEHHVEHKGALANDTFGRGFLDKNGNLKQGSIS